MVYKKHKTFIVPLDKKMISTLVLMGATGIFLYSYCFLYGLQHISAGRGALVVALNPIMVSVIGCIFFKESINAKKILGISIAMIGSLFVISNGHISSLFQSSLGIGELFILGCAVSWTCYTFIGKHISKTLSPLLTNFYSCFVGYILLGFAVLETVFRDKQNLNTTILHLQNYSLQAWICIAYLGIFGTAISYIWFTDGLKHIGASKASAFLNLVPIFGVLFGALILHERLSIAVIIGGVLIITGVILTNKAKN
jgi:drug/metabolite transporter (DMT)-like permease